MSPKAVEARRGKPRSGEGQETLSRRVSLDSLPTLAEGQGAKPKPVRGADRITRRYQRERQAKAFRDAVWNREIWNHEDGIPRCQECGRRVLRTLDVLRPNAGHVAHARGRRVAPADKYNPDAARLKCSRCHLGNDHSMRFA